ncbi:MULTISPECIES: hypothetical protein [Methylobacterium]|nr:MULTISPECIES: hypothetical protein [Methylobacterium]
MAAMKSSQLGAERVKLAGACRGGIDYGITLLVEWFDEKLV